MDKVLLRDVGDLSSEPRQALDARYKMLRWTRRLRRANASQDHGMRTENTPQGHDHNVTPWGKEECRGQTGRETIVGSRPLFSAGSLTSPAAERRKTRACAKCCKKHELDTACPDQEKHESAYCEVDRLSTGDRKRKPGAKPVLSETYRRPIRGRLSGHHRWFQVDETNYATDLREGG
ncbi:hypothetical protein FHT92_003270 [Rhizobium sp. BK377]|nr:hypothetical protein [Rhizobium sp. BK377]